MVLLQGLAQAVWGAETSRVDHSTLPPNSANRSRNAPSTAACEISNACFGMVAAARPTCRRRTVRGPSL